MMSYNFKQKQYPPKDIDILQEQKQYQTKTISTKGYWYPTRAKQYSPKYNNILHGQKNNIHQRIIISYKAKQTISPKDNDIL